MFILSAYTISLYFAFLAIPVLKIHTANKTFAALTKQINRSHHHAHLKIKTHFKKNTIKPKAKISIDEILLFEQNHQHILLTNLTIQSKKNLDFRFKSTFYGAYHLLNRILKLKPELHCYELSIFRTLGQSLENTHLQCKIIHA